MKLDLIIPHFLTAPASAELPFCRLLETMLARSTLRDTKNSYHAQLFSLVNLPEDTSLAWLSAVADNCEQEKFCWRADPVHFQAHTDHALLLDAQSLAIAPDEAAQLVAAFNAHFAADGLQLYAANPQRWYLQCHSTINVTTTPITHAIGRNVRHFLPTGKDAMQWRKILNETQMLFHAHAVNQQREAAGHRTINSLWLWGEGQREIAKVECSASIYADDIVACGVARLANQNKKSVQDWIQQPAKGLLVMDDLVTAASYGDAEAWADAFNNICQNTLPVILAAMKTGKINQINLYPADGRCFELRAADLYKFWRLRKSLRHWMRHDS